MNTPHNNSELGPHILVMVKDQVGMSIIEHLRQPMAVLMLYSVLNLTIES